MEIKILGPGCPNCKALAKMTREMVAELGIDAKIIIIDDILEIMEYQVLSTPALLVNGTVMVRGRVPSAEELRKFLTQ